MATFGSWDRNNMDEMHQTVLKEDTGKEMYRPSSWVYNRSRRGKRKNRDFLEECDCMLCLPFYEFKIYNLGFWFKLITYFLLWCSSNNSPHGPWHYIHLKYKNVIVFHFHWALILCQAYTICSTHISSFTPSFIMCLRQEHLLSPFSTVRNRFPEQGLSDSHSKFHLILPQLVPCLCIAQFPVLISRVTLYILFWNELLTGLSRQLV